VKNRRFFLAEEISFLVRVSLFVLETTKIKVHSPFRFRIFLSFFFQVLTLFSFTSTSHLALANRKAANTTFFCHSFFVFHLSFVRLAFCLAEQPLSLFPFDILTKKIATL